MKVAIIGTAGRTQDSRTKDLTPGVYKKMITKAKELISELGAQPEDIQLVSGGSSWADHVAVTLFLSGAFGGLTLYCPAAFDDDECRFKSSHSKTSDGGATLNFYHERFSKKCKLDSLKEIKDAIDRGAVLDSSSSGFHERNSKVARSGDVVIAFTWNEKEPATGTGTGDTWRKVPKQAHKIHVCLDDL